MHKVFCSLFLVRIIMKWFASHTFDTFNKEWRQVKPKRRQEYGQTWIFFHKSPFWACIKIQHIHFLVQGHSSWSTFGLHLVRGPRLSKLFFLWSRTMEVGRWTQTIDKGHLPWSDFMVHSVNRPWVGGVLKLGVDKRVRNVKNPHHIIGILKARWAHMQLLAIWERAPSLFSVIARWIVIVGQWWIVWAILNKTFSIVCL